MQAKICRNAQFAHQHASKPQSRWRTASAYLAVHRASTKGLFAAGRTLQRRETEPSSHRTATAMSSYWTTKRTTSESVATSCFQPNTPQARDAIWREVLDLRRDHLEHAKITERQYHCTLVHVLLELCEDPLALVHVKFR
jgi:hypothetical protein